MQRRRFVVELIKPSHYDDDGYVIQWLQSWLPSNSLASLYALSNDVARRRALGDEVDIEIHAYDECHTVLPIGRILRRVKAADGALVCMVGVQSNQFPRAVDIARQFRDHEVPVAIGGFHVSGCLAMLPSLPPEIRAAADLGIVLFAGEAEGRLEHLFADALHGRLKPIYNYMDDLPGLQGQITPFLPADIAERYSGTQGAFDAGRGCPFQCSFCTIINVQGRKSRWRDADDVERIVRANVAQGVFRFFITDDNFARNRNWEAIFDRLIKLREEDGLNIRIFIQVDTLCHKIPRFIEKAARAGCRRVYIGLENINPDNLIDAKKRQNRISEYRVMLHAWRAQKTITYAGYILGFPRDTPERIEHDIRVLMEELPIDLLEFFILTPLPGSEDHQKLYSQGAWTDPDMNKYDLEHVVSRHGIMSADDWQGIYRKAWDLYYSPSHIERLLRRTKASGMKPWRLALHILQFYYCFRYERVHPLQGGFFRRKVRRQRRSGSPAESPLLFYPRRVWEVLYCHVMLLTLLLRLRLMYRRIRRAPEAADYMDRALAPVTAHEAENYEFLKAAPSLKRASAVAAQ